jgi:hypothetical protein
MVKYIIPERLGLVQVMRWQANIYEMLSRTPSIHPRDMNEHFLSIRSKLSTHENLMDSPALLELAIWKSNITEQCYGQKNDRVIAKRAKLRCNDSVYTTQCCIESITMIATIVPHVFSFLIDRLLLMM